ncbi:MAG TPA: PAS domain-containing sensor histidine kinase [Methanocella sp.]|uniref:two-component system sensor histidine kinase NtrB n=1 Tax=Methanocella sp. TaxID=2052833 RepID=UPI002BC513B8|nr:PAS domain-containing sensor histidine kinase [Methanocella sp.]HTY90293.1 PAS domain-containing sensor histidine kinase [Methanocella sp.]
MDEMSDLTAPARERYNKLLLLAIIVGCIIVTVYVNLVMGVDVVYTHLYYIPIILAGIWYHRKAIYVAIFLGMAHMAIGYFTMGHVVPDTLIRASIFIVVAIVVGTLSEYKDHLFKDIRLLLESTDEGIYGVDVQGRCTFINRSALRQLGYTKSEALGKDTHDLIHHTRSDGTPCRREQCCVIQSLREGTGCRDSDDVFWRKGGTPFPVEYSSYPIREDGKITGAVVTFVDITERKDAESRVRDARRQAELYVDLMGHDINNMNQIGMSYLELGLANLSLKDDEKIYLEKPLEAFRNSTRLIDTVRKLQMIKEGGLRHEKVDMCLILRDVVSEFSHVPGRDVAIRLESANECYVLADPLLKDVFVNLVGNAIRHSTGPVSVDIRLEPVSRDNITYYRVDISDNGPGIPDELKKRLFGRHQHGETGVTGRGLGLYLVKKLVDDFKGKVWVEDRVPDEPSKGAKFVVMLPALTSSPS